VQRYYFFPNRQRKNEFFFEKNKMFFISV